MKVCFFLSYGAYCWLGWVAGWLAADIDVGGADGWSHARGGQVGGYLILIRAEHVVAVVSVSVTGVVLGMS